MEKSTRSLNFTESLFFTEAVRVEHYTILDSTVVRIELPDDVHVSKIRACFERELEPIGIRTY